MKRHINRLSGLLALILLVTIPFAAIALTAEPRLSDPAMEARAQEVFKDIRCVVCSGESIHDSKADLAKEFRTLIRTKIEEGLSDQDILDYMTQRYGDAVLMQPPVTRYTLLLWLAPLLLLGAGGVVLVRFFKGSVVK